MYGPPPRVLIYGAVDTAEALSRAAQEIGWRPIVADARADTVPSLETDTLMSDPDARRRLAAETLDFARALRG